MIKVVVLGGGFGGVAAAKKILQKTKRSQVRIILIDKNSYHLFTPSMYEVAASEEPKKNICIPLNEILKGVELVRGQVIKIDKDKKEIVYKNHPEILENLRIVFDYLVIALGSEPEFHDIPGLAEYSVPFKSLEDAVRIRNLIKEKKKEKELVQVVVGGGGASGCEFTAELAYHMKKGIKISLVQKSPQLVHELNVEAAKVAYKRLLGENVEICFGERIKKVYKSYIETDTKDKHEFDVLVWAGGICGNSILKSSGFEIDKQGRVPANEELRIMNEERIFAVGDVAFLNDDIPATVRVAKDEGEVAGENVVRKIRGEHLIQYKFRNQIFVVPLVGKYAVVQFNNILIKGFVGWVIQQFVFLRYLLGILPINKALAKWNKFEVYLVR